jgi:hypothetical protein
MLVQAGLHHLGPACRSTQLLNRGSLAADTFHIDAEPIQKIIIAVLWIWILIFLACSKGAKNTIAYKLIPYKSVGQL